MHRFLTGRCWTAPELRRKSFEDLHRLWFVLLKEKNLLLTQQHEATRLSINWLHQPRLDNVFRSMARIKSVLSERKAAFDAARQQIELRDAPDVEKRRVAYIAKMLFVKKRDRRFRRFMRFILNKHAHFD